MELARQESWSVLIFPTPGYLSNTGMEPKYFESLILAGGFFITAPPIVFSRKWRKKLSLILLLGFLVLNLISISLISFNIYVQPLLIFK